jgi:predicted DNA-binding transcriptional regulator AlpA
MSDQTDAPPAKVRRSYGHVDLDSLPSEVSRNRILPTRETLEFVGSSPANWRRLRSLNLAPPPIMIGMRKQGWRVGTLLDWLESRTKRETTAAGADQSEHV